MVSISHKVGCDYYPIEIRVDKIWVKNNFHSNQSVFYRIKVSLMKKENAVFTSVDSCYTNGHAILVLMDTEYTKHFTRFSADAMHYAVISGLHTFLIFTTQYFRRYILFILSMRYAVFSGVITKRDGFMYTGIYFILGGSPICVFNCS